MNIWRKNKKLNNVNFGVPSVIEEVILSTAYCWKIYLGYNKKRRDRFFNYRSLLFIIHQCINQEIETF